MAGYVNISPLIGVVVDRGLASLYELQTVYDYEDLYNLYEIITIKVANEQKIYKREEERARIRRK